MQTECGKIPNVVAMKKKLFLLAADRILTLCHDKILRLKKINLENKLDFKKTKTFE
jgi:hypothetical protein